MVGMLYTTRERERGRERERERRERERGREGGREREREREEREIVYRGREREYTCKGHVRIFPRCDGHNNALCTYT